MGDLVEKYGLLWVIHSAGLNLSIDDHLCRLEAGSRYFSRDLPRQYIQSERFVFKKLRYVRADAESTRFRVHREAGHPILHTGPDRFEQCDL